MNREIEFRAWLKQEKKMIGVNTFCFDTGNVIFLSNDETIGMKNKSDLELIQYTGLKDKNGKKIFEGDVFINEDDGCIGVIRYSEQFAWFIIEWFENSHSKEPLDDEPLGHINIHNMEVIGNIYENPELLEVEDE